MDGVEGLCPDSPQTRTHRLPFQTLFTSKPPSGGSAGEGVRQPQEFTLRWQASTPLPFQERDVGWGPRPGWGRGLGLCLLTPDGRIWGALKKDGAAPAASPSGCRELGPRPKGSICHLQSCQTLGAWGRCLVRQRGTGATLGGQEVGARFVFFSLGFWFSSTS